MKGSAEAARLELHLPSGDTPPIAQPNTLPILSYPPYQRSIRSSQLPRPRPLRLFQTQDRSHRRRRTLMKSSLIDSTSRNSASRILRNFSDASSACTSVKPTDSRI